MRDGKRDVILNIKYAKVFVFFFTIILEYLSGDVSIIKKKSETFHQGRR